MRDRSRGRARYAADVKSFLAICLGGAVGTGARFLVVAASARWLGVAFPFGTLAVNVAGSFLLAVVVELALRGAISPELRSVLAMGVMGGFTTYSSFNQDLIAGVERGAWAWSVGYAAATLAGCLAAGAAGTWVGRAVPGA
jgi:CrcB protein